MKKHLKKFFALTMALCLVLSLSVAASAASNEATVSGGTATSAVSLSSTADGSIGGDPAATKMSVTVPTVLAVAVGTDGTVTTATDAKIVNNSFGAVKVSKVSIEAAQGWSLTAFGTKDSLAHEKVDANKVGFALAIGGGAQQVTDASDAAAQVLLSTSIAGCYMSGAGDQTANSVSIAYDAIVTPVSEAVTNTGIASVLFVVEWDI